MRHSSGILAAILAAMLIVSGCGGGSSTAPTQNQQTNTVTPAPAPAAPFSLTIGINADPPKLDPHQSTALVDRMVFQSIFDKLVDANVKGEIIPMLADKWTIADEGKTYTFNLHAGVKFHDGTDFNADAVKFNFDRMMGVIDPNLKSPRKSEISLVDKVEVVDPLTVKISLKKSFAPFLGVLSDRAGMMISPAAIKQYGDDILNHPIGTGPFKYEDRVKGDHITLVKNATYWRAGLPKADKVTFKTITDGNVAVAQVQAGQVDINDGVPAALLESLKSDQRVKLDIATGQGFQGVHLNTTAAPFNNLKFRQAVSAAIDRAELVAAVFGDAAAPAYSPFAPGSLGDDGAAAPKADVELAKKLVAESGITDPKFTFYIASGGTTGPQLAQVIQSMEAKAGIKVDIQQLEFGKLLDALDKHQFQAGQLGWSGRPDPDQNIYSFTYTGQSNNNPGYSNAQVDKLLDQARTATDLAVRKDAYKQVMQTLRQEVPYLYLWFPRNIQIMSPKLKGFEHNPDGLIRTVNLSK